jgi:hypothetical protein
MVRQSEVTIRVVNAPESGLTGRETMNSDTAENNQSIGAASIRQTTLNEYASITEETTTPPLRTDGGYNEGIDSSQSAKNNEDSQDIDISLSPTVREYIKADRGYSCELCDDDEELEIHHREEQAKNGTNHPDNLILLCRDCHQKHHGNEPIEPASESERNRDQEEVDEGQGDDNPQEDGQVEMRDNTDPLPPRSDPNGADKEILSLIEKKGPLSTGKIAAQTEYTPQYIRRQCWKLAGEQLISTRDDSTWDLAERTTADQRQIGLPDTPKSAARAGRDEVIRQMSAHGISHEQIADITDLSRSTVDIAVNRARALRIDMDEPADIDFAAIATRLSSLVELIDHSRIDPC